jgi:hypothetical protein
MGFRIYRISHSGNRSGDWLHGGFWDNLIEEHLDICLYELMSLTKDEIREELPEWYESLLPFASHPVDTTITQHNFDSKKDTSADIILAFMKRTIDANDTWTVY